MTNEATVTKTRTGYLVDTANGTSTHGNASAAAEMIADLVALDIDDNRNLYRYLRSLLDEGCELVTVDVVRENTETLFDVHSLRNGVPFEAYTVCPAGSAATDDLVALFAEFT